MKIDSVDELIQIAGYLSDEDIAMHWSALTHQDAPKLAQLIAAVRAQMKVRCRCGRELQSVVYSVPFTCSCGRHYAAPTIEPFAVLERLDALQRKHEELLARLAAMGTAEQR